MQALDRRPADATPVVRPDIRPPAVVHVDLDGATDICRMHGWPWPFSDDPVFESGMHNLLDLFSRNRIRATLFVIANSLDQPAKREWLTEAVRRGHEIASHTMTHPDLLALDREGKRREIAGSRARLEDALGVAVRGFRAPGYRIDRTCLELLAEHGYQYDSSAFPTKRFGRRLQTSLSNLARPNCLIPSSGLVELPLPDHRPSPFPFNPSYAHVFGKRYFQWCLRRFRRLRTPLVLLFHLIDAAEPLGRQRLHGWKSRLLMLSHMSAHRKLTRCQSMLDLAFRHFRLTSTNELLRDDIHSTSQGSS